jgi:transcriptional regulator with XRE-family HTH domain
MSTFDMALFHTGPSAVPTFVDAAPVRAHLAQLAAQGIGYRRVAELSGLTVHTVRVISAGRRGSGPRAGRVPERVLHHTAASIYSVPVQPADGVHVESTGARRRVQALIVNGWSQAKIAERLGMNASQFGRVLRQQHVRVGTHAAICGLFEQLWNVAPPMDSEHDRAAAERCRGYSRALGWLPPLAWDDIDADDEAATADVPVFLDEVAVDLAVSGERVHLNRLERISAVLILNRDQHLHDGEISERLGIASESIQRYRRDAGIPAAVNSSKERVHA